MVIPAFSVGISSLLGLPAGREKEMTMTDIEKEFCERLTDLLLDCGLGIAGEPHVYELQSGPDSDYGRVATIDDEGRLLFV